MARRSRPSPFEGLIGALALLPPWACLAVAVASYLLLHPIASRPPAPIESTRAVSHAALQGIGIGLATAGQYLLPFASVLAAGVSWWKRRRRQELVTRVAEVREAGALDGLSWQEFEMLVAESFRLRGYRVLETGGGGADGGVDLVLTRPGTGPGEKLLVQCKQWRALKVGVEVVRELYGVMVARGAAGGFVVTSGRFTPDAKAFAAGREVTLVEGPELTRWIREAREALEARRGRTPRAGAPVKVNEPVSVASPAHAQKPTTDDSAVPDCPVCGKAMTRRVARRGANAGGVFWGCTGFPACRGVRNG